MLRGSGTGGDRKLAIAISGLMNSVLAKQILPTLRNACPGVPIYVTLFQEEIIEDSLEGLAEQLDIKPIELQGQPSNSRARNALISSISEDFVLMIPAGWIPNEPFNEGYLLALCDLIDQNAKWLLIAGNAGKVDYSHLNVAPGIAEPGEVVLSQSRRTQIVDLAGELTELINCDFVTDFFLISRVRLAQMGVNWDERLEGMEHEDFLFQVMRWRQENFGGEVFFLPGLTARPLEIAVSSQAKQPRALRESLISFSRKWQVSRLVRAKKRGGTEVTRLDRDAVWLEALETLTTFLDFVEIGWHLSGTTLQGAVESGHFLSWAHEIEVEALAPKSSHSALTKHLKGSRFRLQQAKGNPRGEMLWHLDYPSSPGDGWSFGPVTVVLSLKLEAEVKKGGDARGGHSGRPVPVDFRTEKIYIASWKRYVNVPSTVPESPPGEYSEGYTDGTVNATGSRVSIAGGLQAVIGSLYRIGLYLRLSTFRFFLFRHPVIDRASSFPLRAYKFARRRIMEWLERIEPPSIRGIFWSTRYRLRKLFSKPFDITQFNLDDFEIRWINLPERKLRKQRLVAEFERMGFSNHQRFEATYDNPGILGCATSHLSALREERLTTPAVIIAEDDIEFLVSRDKIQEAFSEFMSNPTLDVLCLGYNALGPRIDVGKTLQICSHINTASFYVVKNRAMAPLIKCFSDSERHLRRGDPDWIYAQDQLWTRLQKGRLFFAIPRFQVLRQRPDYSSIERASVDYGV